MTKITLFQPIEAPAQSHKRDAHQRGRRTIALRLALSSLPLLVLALSEPFAPVEAQLWLAVALYSGLIAWASGGTPIKFMELGAAAVLCSLALVNTGQ
jgi:hypothetical protein